MKPLEVITIEDNEEKESTERHHNPRPEWTWH